MKEMISLTISGCSSKEIRFLFFVDGKGLGLEVFSVDVDIDTVHLISRNNSPPLAGFVHASLSATLMLLASPTTQQLVREECSQNTQVPN